MSKTDFSFYVILCTSIVITFPVLINLYHWICMSVIYYSYFFDLTLRNFESFSFSDLIDVSPACNYCHYLAHIEGLNTFKNEKSIITYMFFLLSIVYHTF